MLGVCTFYEMTQVINQIFSTHPNHAQILRNSDEQLYIDWSKTWLKRPAPKNNPNYFYNIPRAMTIFEMHLLITKFVMLF